MNVTFVNNVECNFINFATVEHFFGIKKYTGIWELIEKDGYMISETS